MFDDKTDPYAEDPNFEPVCNNSGNKTFAAVCAARYGRRTFLQGTVAGAALGFVGAAHAKGPKSAAASLDFDAIPQSTADVIKVPAGYTETAFLPWGTPITGAYPTYIDGGLNTGAEQEQQIGMHHDGMHFFPINGSSVRGLLVMNHEYIEQQYLHASLAGVNNSARTDLDGVRKEIAAHGVSIVEIGRTPGGWDVIRGAYNRRITANTPMELTGPVRGDDKVKTKYSPTGVATRGTVNNCAHGYTAWNTYLTCEENWAGYFFNNDPERPREHVRYGVATNGRGRYGWGTVDSVDDYTRFNASTRGADATEDYRNEPNTYGWVVEIDPFDPTSTPKKRTALGRFGHEGAWMAPVQQGQPVTVYMGDDSRFEYVYKFVSKGRWMKQLPEANRELLADGTLYVARFNEDGSGEWIALTFGENGLTPENGFTSQADVLLNTRLAADLIGATPMDRPEWGTVDKRTGDVYMTFTNNSRRGADDTTASSPRGPNPFGHIIRWRELGNRYWATKFNWDIFMLGGPANGDSLNGVTGDPLGVGSEFSSPDGIWYDNGIVWIQTDGNAFGHDQMLACVPETGDIRRFFTGVINCEVTGVVSTPDYRTLFVNIQHPGEGDFGSSNWPDGDSNRPRSATVIVERANGGVIARS